MTLWLIWTMEYLCQKVHVKGHIKHFYSRLTSPWVPMLLSIQKYKKKIGSHNGSQLSRCITKIAMINVDDYSKLLSINYYKELSAFEFTLIHV